MPKTIKNIFYTLLAISLCLWGGKLIHSTIAGLPASLYGMILYCLLLQLTWLDPHKISTSNQWIIKNMGICFVPAALGVMNHFELIKNHGLALVSIIFFTTFLLLTLVGLLAERYIANTDDSSSPLR